MGKRKQKTAFERAGVPDPEENFEGCINGIVDQVVSELEKIPEEERDLYWLKTKCEHMARLIDLKAPDILIRMSLDGLEGKITALREKYPPLPKDFFGDDDDA